MAPTIASTVVDRPAAEVFAYARRRLGGGVGGLRRGVVPVAAEAGLVYGLADPAADAVDELLAGRGLGVTHAGHEPELLGFPGRHVQLAGVLRREVVVVLTVHDQQRHRRDLRRRLG